MGRVVARRACLLRTAIPRRRFPAVAPAWPGIVAAGRWRAAALTDAPGTASTALGRRGGALGMPVLVRPQPANAAHAPAKSGVEPARGAADPRGGALALAGAPCAAAAPCRRRGPAAEPRRAGARRVEQPPAPAHLCALLSRGRFAWPALPAGCGL